MATVQGLPAENASRYTAHEKPTMPIKITRHEIDTALPKVKVGLEKYMWLQDQVAKNLTSFHTDPLFQRKYNGFYKVQRRNNHWMSTYYKVMAQAVAEGLSFKDILYSLHKETSRIEASFASKMFATLHPSAPVIDSWVLLNTGRKLPYAKAKNRLQAICTVHANLGTDFSDYLANVDGQYLVSEFTRLYGSGMTSEKMLDFVLWQTRPPKASKTSSASSAS